MLTLKTRLTLWYSLIWILFVLAFTATLYFAVKRSIRNEVKDFLRAEALAVSQSFTLTPTSFHIYNLTPWLELEHQLNSDYAVFLQVLDGSGRVLKRSDNLVAAREFLPAVPIAEKSAGTFVEISQQGIPFFLYYQPIHETSGTFVGWMQVAAYEKRVTTFLQVVSDWLLIGMFGALLPCVLVGWWMARQALAPLQHIAGMAASITSDKLSTRIPVPKAKSKEIVELVTALNALLLRLENAFFRVSQFTNDAAHELLTPLTSLQSDIEITLRRERDKDDYVASLQRLQGDTGRMVEIIRSLLFLARSDRRQLSAPFAELDPNLLAEEILDDLAPQIFSKQLEVDFAPCRVRMKGNETLLRQMLMNIVKNAIAYTHVEGNIRIQSEIAEAHWVCQISDNGVGIPENMHESIFERFFRVDPSRQRESGGIGLGLAIAREIAYLHGGTLRLAWSEAGKGSRFEIRLPLKECVTN